MAFFEQRIIPYHAVDSIGPGPVLILAPHPDDEVFGCGGALLRHVEAGDAVRVVILTDGGRGVDDSGEYVRQRRQESLKAAALLGYSPPVFWELPDRGLEYGEPLIRRLLESIEDSAAALVYAPSWWEAHPDHRALAMAAAEAVRRSESAVRLVFYEIGVPLPPNALLDITGLLERKQQAMACFASQLALQSYDRQILALNRYRTYTLPETVQAAEAYRVLSRDELRAMPGDPDPGRIQRTPEPSGSVRQREPRSEPRAELEALESRAAFLQNTLEEIYQSTSWRVTGPLRWISSRWQAIAPPFLRRRRQ